MTCGDCIESRFRVKSEKRSNRVVVGVPALWAQKKTNQLIKKENSEKKQSVTVGNDFNVDHYLVSHTASKDSMD